MNKLIQALALTSLMFSTISQAETYENYVINLDWNNPSTLKDNLVQQCDDSYFPALEIVIPGQPAKDFYVSMNVDISRGKISVGCDIKMIKGTDSTTYLIDADGGGCTITVDEETPTWTNKRRQAVYELADSC